jgi:hypothetical protein
MAPDASNAGMTVELSKSFLFITGAVKPNAGASLHKGNDPISVLISNWGRVFQLFGPMQAKFSGVIVRDEVFAAHGHPLLLRRHSKLPLHAEFVEDVLA